MRSLIILPLLAMCLILAGCDGGDDSPVEQGREGLEQAQEGLAEANDALADVRKQLNDLRDSRDELVEDLDQSAVRVVAMYQLELQALQRRVTDLPADAEQPARQTLDRLTQQLEAIQQAAAAFAEAPWNEQADRREDLEEAIDQFQQTRDDLADQINQ